MCEAISAMNTAQLFWSSMAMTVATTLVNYAAQTEQANQAREYQERVAAEQNRAMVENATIANKEFVEQSAAQNIQLAQKEQSYSEEAQRVQVQREKNIGTAVASSENAGLSLDSLLGDFYRSEAKYKAALAQQYNMDYVQRDINVSALHDKAENRSKGIAQYVPSPVSRPNPLGAALQIGGGLMTNYYTYSDKMTDPTTGKVLGRRLF